VVKFNHKAHEDFTQREKWTLIAVVKYIITVVGLRIAGLGIIVQN
jgi:hypothetical protein